MFETDDIGQTTSSLERYLSVVRPIQELIGKSKIRPRVKS